MTSPSGETPAGSRWWPLLVTGLAAAGLLALIWSKSAEQVIQTFTHDDTFYYLETARRAALGQGFTFDGHTPTNGFHPLWMALLTLIYAVVDGSRETLLRVVLSAQAVLFLTPSLLLAHALGRRLLGSAGGLAALGLGLALLPSRQVNGMESGVLVLMSLVVAWAIVAGDVLHPAAPARKRWLLGVLLALVFLARTDSVFLLLGVGLTAMVWFLATEPGPFAARLGRFTVRFLPVVLLVLVLTAPYLLWNKLSFGHLMPISGAIKSSLPHIGFTTRYVETVDWAMLAVVIPAGAWALLRLRRGLGTPLDAAASAFGFYGLFHVTFTVLAMRWAVFPWHFHVYAVALLVALAWAAATFAPAGTAFHRRRPALMAFVALLLVAGAARTVWALRDRPLRVFYVGAYRAGRWAAQHLPRDARIGMKDAGAFGYFSERAVSNLDGVISNYAYQEALRDGRLAAWLAQRNVRYLAQHALWEHPAADSGVYDSVALPYRSNLYRDAPPNVITVRREHEVYRAANLDARRGTTHFVIWEIR